MKTSLLIALLITFNTYSQSNAEVAAKKVQEAVTLMDNAKYDESIKLMKEAIKLDPKYTYFYELAFAHYLKADYKGAIKILDKKKNDTDVSDQLFQLIGNSYDFLGKPEKAIEAYDEGIKKFPNSGPLHLEKGNVYYIQKEYNKALTNYEIGIDVDPKFPSNYYRATLLYLNSNDEVWGMIYGEIFMNLEPNSKRTAEISKLLFDTYKSEITFKNDSTASTSFCKTMTININTDNSNEIKLPFPMIYESTLIVSVALEKAITLESLNRIRATFIANYYNAAHNEKYPNILFDFQKELKDAGYFEAYNYWICMKGDEAAFVTWQTENKVAWDNFISWYSKNRITIDKEHKFSRFQ